MSFDPESFYHLAEKLYASDDSESALRTVIGRAYYSAFLIAKKHSPINSTSGSVHELVCTFYKNSDDPAKAAIGNRLDNMRKTRNEADYDCAKTFKKNEAGKSIGLGRNILNSFGYELNKLDTSI